MWRNKKHMKKTTKNVLTNYGDKEELVVQKSKNLLSLWKSDLTLAEFKILDAYLARINSKHPEKDVVIFSKGKLEELMGVKKINKKDLNERLKHLIGNVVDLNEESEDKGKLVTLFEEAELERDSDGTWIVKMRCTRAAHKYFFDVETLGYLKYKLRNIVRLKSRHTYIMFLYLEDNRFRKEWEIDIYKLREILSCTDSTYDDFRYFNRDVLKKIQKVLIEDTECKYMYEVIRSGRSAKKIRFKVESRNKYLDIESNIKDYDAYNIRDELWVDALEPLKLDLSREHLEELWSILNLMPEFELPNINMCEGSREIQHFHYMDRKVKEIERRSKEKKIYDKYKYLLKIMKRDAGII